MAFLDQISKNLAGYGKEAAKRRKIQLRSFS